MSADKEYYALMNCPVCSDRQYIKVTKGETVNSYTCNTCRQETVVKNGDCCVFGSYGRCKCREEEKNKEERREAS